MLTYAVADIHGMCEMLRELLTAVADDAAGAIHRVVFLGDYVDRGPDSRQTIELLRTGPTDPACIEWVLLKGNHDAMMVDAVLGSTDHWARSDWEANGGDVTLRGYLEGYDDPSLIVDARFLRDRTKLWFRDETGRIYVHAGLRPGGPPEIQKEHDMLWIREEFLFSRFDFGGLVVHGHSITETGMPEEKTNRLALDTGSFLKEGFVTVGRFDDDAILPKLYLRTAHSRYGAAPVTKFVPERQPTETSPSATV
jgi:serine/threonine protein phosphatase 1